MCDSQIVIPESFSALFRNRAGRLLTTAHEVAQRYELCEDLACALVEQAQHLYHSGHSDEEAVLQGLHHSINTPQTGLAAAEAVWVTLRLAELLAWRAPQLLLPAAGGFDVGGGLASADSFSSASSLADSSRTD